MVSDLCEAFDFASGKSTREPTYVAPGGRGTET
jgi:hypothetical protein